MNWRIIVLMAIVFLFTITVGCTSTSQTTDPIIGSWQKVTEKNTVYLEFYPDYTIKQWSSDSPDLITGSWKNEGSDWYSVATYAEDSIIGKTYLSTYDWIYDKTRDAIYVKGYPEGRFSRATQPLTTPPITTRAAPIFSPGDIIDAKNSQRDNHIVIMNYDPSTDHYEINSIFKKDDGQWGCTVVNSWKLLRGMAEEIYPEKYGHVSPERVQDCYGRTTTTTIS